MQAIHVDRSGGSPQEVERRHYFINPTTHEVRDREQTLQSRIADWARSHGLALHCDGARLMNAVVASGVPASEWGRHFDTVSMCWSRSVSVFLVCA